MVKWYFLPVALAVGFFACWLAIVVPAGKRADVALAAANAKYLTTQGQLDASTSLVHDLEGKLGSADSQLSDLAGQLSKARASAAAASATSGQLAAELERLRKAIADGASGLANDEGLVGQLADLIRSSLKIAGGL